LENKELKSEFVQKLNVNKAHLIEKLGELSIVIKINKSDTNYLLVKFKDSDHVFKYLIANKVIVRDRSTEINCEGCLRITVGNETENQKLIEILKTYNH
jgi:histidinol-phosphate aminotransferase